MLHHLQYLAPKRSWCRETPRNDTALSFINPNQPREHISRLAGMDDGMKIKGITWSAAPHQTLVLRSSDTLGEANSVSVSTGDMIY